MNVITKAVFMDMNMTKQLVVVLAMLDGMVTNARKVGLKTFTFKCQGQRKI